MGVCNRIWLQAQCFWPDVVNIVYFIAMIHSQAMEEHRVRQVRIVDALEMEKKKISKELEEMQMKRALRGNQIHKNCERL